jgi:hypothetical protein
MRAVSNAFFMHAEIVHLDRWSHGPLEIAFMDEPRFPTESSEDRSRFQVSVNNWNQSYAAGSVRDGEALEELKKYIPSLENRRNPNLIVSPRLRSGITQLHVMLASLLPDAALEKAHLERRRSNMGLTSMGTYDLPGNYPQIVESLFAKHIWTKLAPGSRSKPEYFSANSPLRLLAGDARFWMHRIYRLALERREAREEVAGEDSWKSLEEIEKNVREQLPVSDHHLFKVRRPLYGCEIWVPEDAESREDILSAAIDGNGVLPSLDPVIALIQQNRAHDDFSSQYSHIKEDFERQFYSKRAKLKVDIVETVDDAPVWGTSECDGYGEVLFRDVFAALDLRERRLILAIRAGKTVTEIAKEAGHAGHAAISRRIKQIQAKVRRLLN